MVVSVAILSFDFRPLFKNTPDHLGSSWYVLFFPPRFINQFDQISLKP